MKTLTIKTKLITDTLKIKDAKDFIGKEVEITIKEIENGKPQKRIWRYSGAIDLNGKADNINIRDIAYE